MSIFVKFSKNFNFAQILGQTFRKFRKISLSVKFSTNFDFCKISEKFRVCSKFSKNIWKISKNIDMGQIFRKISIWVKILEKFRFWSKFSNIAKNVDFSKIFEKFRFWSNFSKNFDFFLFKFFEKFRFCSNFRYMTFLVKFSKKNFIKCRF